ncbi:MAG: hypothetical protein ACXQTI_01540 [Candidatus Nezhaarchaeales archaeon]
MLRELNLDDITLLRAMSGWSRVNTRMLMSTVNFKRTKFYNCINKLIRLGLINRILTGEYELTEQGRILAERLIDPSDASKILNGEGEPLRLKISDSEIEIRNLSDFRSIVSEVENEDLYQQVRTSNLSRWLYAIGDRYLSREINKLRTMVTRSNVKDRLKNLIEERIRFLEELVSLAALPRRGRPARQY